MIKMSRWSSTVLFVAIFSAILMKLPSAAGKQNSITSDVCEYNIDLKSNTVRAKCHGQPLGVNVYATSASVEATNVKVDPAQPSVSQPGVPVSNTPPPPPDVPSGPDNTTKLLKSMKMKLTSQKSAISNISNLLSRGDSDLRSDLQALRGLASDDNSVRESIIATMRNQYNFMRTAILAHNAELSEVLDLLDSLVTLTSRTRYIGYQSQQILHQQLSHVNRTMQSMRSAISSCAKKCHKKKTSNGKDQCPRAVSSLGNGEALRAPWDQGVVMTDSADSSDRMWVMGIRDGRDQVRQYNSRNAFNSQVVARYFSLPFYCEGTGHVVFRNALFCHKAGTRTITKYNLKRMEVSAEVDLPSAGVRNTFPYQFRLNSDIDLAVDELGLWVIYSTKESAGKMVISKLHPRSLVIEKTWLTSYPKKKVGNTFMVCGVLYATNSFEDTPTFIRYMFDTNSQQEMIYEAGNLVFDNAVSFNSSKQAESVMLDYASKQHKLYSWSNGQIQIFPVYFK